MARAACAVLFLAVLTCGAAQSDPGEGAGKLAGEECTLPAGGAGVCRRISGCPEAKEALRKGEALVVCSYEELRPVVCCANISAAARMCAKYSEAVFRYEKIPTIIPQTAKIDQCAMKGASSRRKRVVGGERAGANEFPHMALLGYGTSLQDPSPWMCGGSLISNRFVLTVAHCIADTKRKPNFVRLGELIVNSTEESQHRDYRVAAIIAHPEFKVGAFYNNIGLLRLAEDVAFTASIRPACLHTRGEIVGAPIVTGWGKTETGLPSTHLLKLNMPILKTEVCQKQYQSLVAGRLPKGIDEESMICIGTMVNDKDTCSGDSGGPLQVALETPYCMYSVVGLVAFGHSSCSNGFPSVCTRVSHYVPWIEGVVWPDEA